MTTQKREILENVKVEPFCGAWKTLAYKFQKPGLLFPAQCWENLTHNKKNVTHTEQ